MAYLVRIEKRTDREAPPLDREVICVGSVEKCREAYRREPPARPKAVVGVEYELRAGGKRLPLSPKQDTGG